MIYLFSDFSKCISYNIIMLGTKYGFAQSMDPYFARATLVAYAYI